MSELKTRKNFSTNREYATYLKSKIPNTIQLPSHKDFETHSGYFKYLINMIYMTPYASNSIVATTKKRTANATVVEQRQKNQQGYSNNTARMSELRKQLLELSKTIYSKKEKNWKTNTSLLEEEKNELQNELTRLEYPEIFKNGKGGRRTHKKRSSFRTCKRRRFN